MSGRSEHSPFVGIILGASQNTEVGDMSAPKRLEYEWLRNLETFLSSKLRSRGTAVPRAQLGYVLDGIVLAIDDNAQRAQESLQAVIGFLRGARDPVSRLQAWCLIDAILKQSVLAEIQSELSKSLPRLIAHEMPLGAAESGEAEFTLSYLCILRSWVEQRLLPADLLGDVEGHTLHAVIANRPKSTDNTASKGTAAKVAEAVQQLRQARHGKGNASTSQQGAPSTGNALVAKFVAAAYNPSRVATCCLHCGAQFTTVEARDRHHRTHFSGSEDAAKIRLHYPSADAFLEHVPSHHTTGSNTPLIVDVSTAKRLGFRTKVETISRKRPRQDGLEVDDPVVNDLSKSYRCEVCTQNIQPVVVSRGGQSVWVLPSCVPISEGSFAHRSCVV